jgi:N-alpha-acetyltransferase 15/16, NatA auxiliary subunit
MKGMILHSTEKPEEGYTLVKEALKESKMGSFVCWNIYGLMFKADRNYPQAAKCYVNVSKLKSGDLQVLKDLANIQAQARDFKGLIVTREKILQLKTTIPQNWIGFSVAHRLEKNYLAASKVIDTFFAGVDKV